MRREGEGARGSVPEAERRSAPEAARRDAPGNAGEARSDAPENADERPAVRSAGEARSDGAAFRIETTLVHRGEEPNLGPGGSGDVVVPIHLSTTFARREMRVPTRGYEYARSANPTRDAVEARLAGAEGARYGLACSSGVAAETLILLSVLRSGDHVVAFDDLYGGSRRLFERVFGERFGVEFTFVDARDSERVRGALRDNTRLIWLESPTNPLLKLCDIGAISDIARGHGDGDGGRAGASDGDGGQTGAGDGEQTDTGGRGCLVVMDNTFASPYFQQPLSLGVDIVVHSTTKYLGGHSDSVGGAVMLNDTALYERLKFTQNSAGMVMSPFDSYLLMRGMKTLALRMRAIEENALRIAHYLADHPKVRAVIYPGLPDYPQAELAARQMSGAGGMITFFLTGGLSEAERFLRQVRLIAVAESLGAVETLIEHPAIMTHASVPRHEREKIGISDSLIRLSVGIEHVEDIIADLERAFAAL